MSLEEWLSKVEYEGGLYDALIGYGLKVEELEDGAISDVAREALNEYVILGNKLQNLEYYLQDALGLEF